MTVPLPASGSTSWYSHYQQLDRLTRPTPVTLTASGGVITPDASAGITFRYVATADVTLAEPTNSFDGQTVIVEVLASGAARTLTITGVGSVSIPAGQWWVGEFTRDATSSTWLLNDAAGSTTISSGSSGGGQAVYNVVSTYGADKAGVVEATTAIQNAINAASTAGGGVVYLPAGTYLLNSTLTMKTQVTLKGDGRGATVLYQNSNTAAAITATDQKDMVIEDMVIAGTEAGTNTGIVLARSTQPDIARVTLRRIEVTGFQTSINASNPITSVFDTVFCDSGQTGFYIHGVNGGAAGTSTTFLSCYAAGFTQSGYRIDTMCYCSFVGCAADSNGIGYELIAAGTQGISFTGCGNESTVNQSTSYPGIGWKLNAPVGVSLEGCFTYDMANTSIWVTGNAQAVKVGGFSENTPQSAVTNSIKVDTGCSAVLEAVATVKPVSLATGTTSQIKVNGTSAL